MDKESLIANASGIKPPSQKSLKEYASKKIMMAELVIHALLDSRDIADALPIENLDVLKDNIKNQFKFMESVFMNYNPGVFVNTIAWAYSTNLNHGFQEAFWDYLFPVVLKVYRDNLTTETDAELAPFYEWMKNHKAEFVKIAQE